MIIGSFSFLQTSLFTFFQKQEQSLNLNFEQKKTTQTCTIRRGYEICHTNFTST